MIQVLDFVKESLENGEAVAMVVLTESDAHTPGRSGAIMAVRRDGTTSGTVGGGAMEFELTKEALECLEAGKGHDFQRNLKKEYGMICGGAVKGYINVLNPGERLIIFGGGHVAQAVAKVAEIAGMMVVIVEDRPEFQEAFRDTVQYRVMNPVDAVDVLHINSSDYVLIVTRGHQYDKDILETLVEKDLAYIGMIGSRPKVISTYKDLHEKGISKEHLAKVYAPVGLNIDNGSVGEIAVSIMSELLLIKNKKELRHRQDNLVDKI